MLRDAHKISCRQLINSHIVELAESLIEEIQLKKTDNLLKVK